MLELRLCTLANKPDDLASGSGTLGINAKMIAFTVYTLESRCPVFKSSFEPKTMLEVV